MRISLAQLVILSTQQMDQLCSAFLWSGPALSQKKAKVAWQDVCTPKEEGGLGLRSINEANKVSCYKLIWRLLSSNSLWARWIHIYLIKRASFWSISETTTLGSWMWKKLLKYRDSAAGFVRVTVKNGLGTSFWFDNWSPLGKLIDIAGHRGCIDMGISLHSSVADAFECHRRRRHRLGYLNDIETALQETRQKRVAGENDVVLWKGRDDRFKPVFSTRETWDAIREAKPRTEWYKGIWFAHSTPKYSFISWLATRNRLATGDRMLRWRTGVNPLCVLCQAPLEDRDHLLFRCKYSEEVWSGLSRTLLGTKFTKDGVKSTRHS